MNNPTGLWGVNDAVAVLKLSGEWRFEKSPLLEQVIHELLPTLKVSTLIVDLSEASLIDSTILGLIAQIGILFSQHSHQQPILIVIHTELKELLQSLAFDTLFDVSSRATEAYPTLSGLKGQQVDEAALKDNILHSHETLTSLSENNKKAFADLIRMLS